MPDYKRAYLREMDKRGIKYSEINDRMVRVVYSGENLSSIKIIVCFDGDGEHLVQFACMEVASFKDDKKYAAALLACNQLNARFRWVKFYLDSDRDIRVEADAIVDIDTVGAECCEIVSRMVNIIDEAYTELMKVKIS